MNWKQLDIHGKPYLATCPGRPDPILRVCDSTTLGRHGARRSRVPRRRHASTGHRRRRQASPTRCRHASPARRSHASISRRHASQHPLAATTLVDAEPPSPRIAGSRHLRHASRSPVLAAAMPPPVSTALPLVVHGLLVGLELAAQGIEQKPPETRRIDGWEEA
jgi:hypothetical protein